MKTGSTSSQRTLSIVFILSLVFIILLGTTVLWKQLPWTNTDSHRRKTVEKALRFSLSDDPTLKIIGFSKTDSIVDYRFFNENDARQLMEILDYLSAKTMEEYNLAGYSGGNDARMIELSTASTNASRAMDAVMTQLSTPVVEHGRLTGWKIKVVYEITTAGQNPVRQQFWAVLSPEGDAVLQSFTLPYLESER